MPKLMNSDAVKVTLSKSVTVQVLTLKATVVKSLMVDVMPSKIMVTEENVIATEFTLSESITVNSAIAEKDIFSKST